jgi:hypothetical protein
MAIGHIISNTLTNLFSEFQSHEFEDVASSRLKGCWTVSTCTLGVEMKYSQNQGQVHSFREKVTAQCMGPGFGRRPFGG